MRKYAQQRRLTCAAYILPYPYKALGFKGLIITDALEMDAIHKVYGEEESCLAAVKAGNDIILTSNYTKGYWAVLNAVKDGSISEEKINESVRRILAWKLCYEVIP